MFRFARTLGTIVLTLALVPAAHADFADHLECYKIKP